MNLIINYLMFAVEEFLGLAANFGSTSGIASNHVDTAFTRSGLAAVVTEEPDVTRLTPGSTPRVLDDPVALASFSTITSGQDTVVQISTASIRDDTARVELPVQTRGIDGNRDGLLSNGLNQGVGVVGRDISVGLDGDGRFARRGFARTILSSVGIVTFSAETTISNDEFESLVHQTTFATFVTIAAGAVNQFLFRQRDHGGTAVFNHVISFNRASGREGPAGTALTLILDGGDLASSSPVNRGGGLDGSIKLSNVLGANEIVLDVDKAVVLSAEFVVGHITELVHGQFVSAFSLGLVAANVVQVVTENSSTASLFSGRSVGLAVFSGPLGENIFVFV